MLCCKCSLSPVSTESTGSDSSERKAICDAGRDAGGREGPGPALGPARLGRFGAGQQGQAVLPLGRSFHQKNLHVDRTERHFKSSHDQFTISGR